MDCANITFEKDIIIQETYLIGEIIMWPKTISYPDGFVACDGGSYSKSGKYEPLYDVIGERFGSTATDFNVPNLNVSNTNTPILIKGDGTMNNSGNKELGTTVNNVSDGVNKITNEILPSHNHNINTNISVNFSVDTLSIKHNGGGFVNFPFDSYRPNSTAHNQDNQGAGSKDQKEGIVPNHSHTIEYSGSNTHPVSNHNLNIPTFTSNDNSSSESNIIPESSKIHYIIFTGIKNLT